MKRSDRWKRTFVILGLFLLAAGITTTSTHAQRPSTATEERLYSYTDFTKWVLESVPKAEQQPIHLVLVFDRTDSVNGKGMSDQVLPNIWRKDLFGMLLQEFFVQGRNPDEGDRLTVGWFGRKKTHYDTVWNTPFYHTTAASLTDSYPQPFTQTPRDLQGSDPIAALNDAIAWVQRDTPQENAIVVLVTDDIIQGPTRNDGSQAMARRHYLAHMGAQLSNSFTALLWSNNFPDPTTFVRFDRATNSVNTITRSEANESVKAHGGVPPDQGVRRGRNILVPGYAARNAERQEELERQQRTLLLYTLLGVLVFVSLWMILLDWYRAHYKVKIDSLDKIVWVCPLRRGRTQQRVQSVMNPQLKAEKLGVLRTTGPGLLGLHRLVLRPDGKYVLTDSHGNTASLKPIQRGHAGRKMTAIPLTAGRQTPVDNRITYATVGTEPPAPTTSGNKIPSADDPDIGASASPAGPRSGQVVIPVQRRGLFTFRYRG